MSITKREIEKMCDMGTLKPSGGNTMVFQKGISMESIHYFLKKHNKKNAEQERILCAAVKFRGAVITGYRHSDCYKIIEMILGFPIEDAYLPDRSMEGFLSSKKRFVNRKEAWNIAKKAGQILFGFEVSDKGDDSILISENLY